MSRKATAPVIGNKDTGVYHDAIKRFDACRIGAIKKSNRVNFHGPESAEAAEFRPGRNYRACKRCYKPSFTSIEV